MRKLLKVGLLAAAIAAGCESSKNPVGPGTVVVERSTSSVATSTTTTLIPALRFIATPAAAQAQPALPNDISLFLQQLTGSSTSGAGADLLAAIAPRANGTFRVQGVFSTLSGVTGSVQGQMTGTPTDGTFTGTLRADVRGCVAEREFSGPVNAQYLQWTGGAILSDCPSQPLGFSSVMLLKTDAPPPTTTSVSTTTSTSTQTSTLPCNFTLSPTSALFEREAGSGTVIMNTRETCAWTVQSTAAWITVLSPLTGLGSTSVRYTITANTGAQRSGSLIIAGIPFVVTQNGPSTTTTTTTDCSFTLSPTSALIGASTFQGTVDVNTRDGCNWSVQAAVDWITLQSPALGQGRGTVRYLVAENRGSQRSGALVIAGIPFFVTQNAPVATSSSTTSSSSSSSTTSSSTTIASTTSTSLPSTSTSTSVSTTTSSIVSTTTSTSVPTVPPTTVSPTTILGDR
jgi:hypothetical protein